MMTRNDRGSILLAALIIALVLGITCASLVIFTAANTAASQYGLRRAEALTCAEIGVERAKMSIAEGAFASQFSSQSGQAIATWLSPTPPRIRLHVSGSDSAAPSRFGASARARSWCETSPWAETPL